MGQTLQMKLDGVRWVPAKDVEVDGGLQATHEGVWNFQGFDLRVYKLTDGRTVINADDAEALFEWLHK